MKYIKAIGAALLAFLAFLAAVKATQHRARAKGILDAQEDDLIATAEVGTGKAQEAARLALEHLEKAKDAEARATELVTKGAMQDETLESISDRWRSRSSSVRSKPATVKSVD